MFSDFPEEYFRRAEDCRAEARRASRAVERAEWLALADEWLRLAQVSPAESEPSPEAEPKREAA